MLWWIILENIILIRLPTFSWGVNYLVKSHRFFKFGNKFQISVKFHANFIFQVRLYFKFYAANFIEILLIWYSWDTFQLVKFLIIEKRMRSKRLVHLKKQRISMHKHTWSKQNSKWKNPNYKLNFKLHISYFKFYCGLL